MPPTPPEKPQPQPTEGPGTEFTDPTRIILATIIQQEIGCKVCSIPWACLWLADIEKLQALPGRVAHSLIVTMEGVHHVLESVLQCKDLVRLPESDEDSCRSSTVDGDTENVYDLCKKRDQNSCVITKAEDLLVTMRLFPHTDAMRVPVTREKFWSALRLFWSDARVDGWKEALSCGQGIDTLSNLMTVGPDVFGYWKRARFALKPLELSDDGKCLRMQFFWLRRLTKPSVLDESAKGASLLERLDTGHGRAKLWGMITEQKIVSGDVVTLKTIDPAKYPLPSMTLLDMMWVLNRVASISSFSDFGEFDD